MTEPRWRRLDAEALEAAYTPASTVPSLDPYVRWYAEAGAAVRATHPPVTLAYGDHPDEALDYWAGPARGGPLHVFVHGGYWRRLSKEDGSLLAPGFLAAGSAYASIGYSLLPAVTLDVLVDQVRRALRFLHDHAKGLGHDATRIVASGHSAGAHLVAMALGDVPLAGAVLVSGVLDVEPVPLTSVNVEARLDATAARRFSPLAQVGAVDTGMVIAYAEHDTDEFKRQSLAYALARYEAANPVPVVLEVAGRNHFDVIADLADPTTALGRATLALAVGP